MASSQESVLFALGFPGLEIRPTEIIRDVGKEAYPQISIKAVFDQQKSEPREN